jgi:DNA-binding beta-propeller fold protein YncE
VAIVTVGADPGAQVFDPETKYLYSACGDGTLSIFRQVNKEVYRLQQTLEIHRGCAIIALDPRTKKVYLPVTGTKPETVTDNQGKEINQPADCWVYAHQ